MSTRTYTRTFTVGGHPADMDAVTFADPAAEYGVKRNDTGAVVVAAGVAFPRVALGTYSYSFADPAPGLTYTYALRVAYGGGVYYETVLGALPVAVGVYGDETDIQAEVGPSNEAIFADPDNLGNATLALTMKQKASDYADSVINARLAANNFLTPATKSLGMLRIVYGKLAAWQLGQVRGIHEAKGNPFAEKRAEAMVELGELTFMNRGGFVRAVGYSDAPFGVGATTGGAGNCGTRWWDGTCWRW